MAEKTRLVHLLPTRDSRSTLTARQGREGKERIFHENGNKTEKAAGVAMLVSGRTDFKRKALTTDKEGPSTPTPGAYLKKTKRSFKRTLAKNKYINK